MEAIFTGGAASARELTSAIAAEPSAPTAAPPAVGAAAFAKIGN